MRNVHISLCVATAVTAAATALTITPAHADEAWFGPKVDSSINNSAGPGPAPRGAATADFNEDGHPDLVSIGDFTLGDLRVSLGHGDGTFAAASTVPGSAQTQGIDVGDLNGDGHADVIAMSVYDAKIFAGDGNGNFSRIGTYSLTLGGQVQPLIVDLDGDGDNDVVAPSFTSIQALVNNGDGTFTKKSTWVLGASVLSGIAVADLDADAKADLFAVDGLSGTTFALKGNGNGTFTLKSSMYASAFIPEDVAAIDLNGDGYDDAATIGSFSFSLATGLTDGNGAFTSPIPATFQFGGPGPTSAAVADFNADGKDDLVVSSLANPLAGTLTVLAGDGTPGMRAAGSYASAAFPQNPVLADYDGDGDIDIAVVAPGTISFLPNTLH